MNQVHLAQAETYPRLSKDDRIVLAVLLSTTLYKQCQIAAMMKRHPSTIGREIRRGGGKGNYLANHAHELAQVRMRACANARRIAPETWATVEFLLAFDLGPEQIWTYLRENELPGVSPEWIYQRIYAAKLSGGLLHLGLRCQKARRKRYGSYRRRGVIANPDRSHPATGPGDPDRAPLALRAHGTRALQDRGERLPGHHHTTQPVQKHLPTHDYHRQRQRVRLASAHRQEAELTVPLRPSLLLLGTGKH